MGEQHVDVIESPLNEVRAIVDRNLFAIFAGMVSHEFFSNHGEKGAADDYVRLKQLLNINHGVGDSGLAMIRGFEKKSPDLYQHAIQELQCQVAMKVLRRSGGLHDELFMGAVFLLYVFASSGADWDPDQQRRVIEQIERGDYHCE